jgi:hypothetical protein
MQKRVREAAVALACLLAMVGCGRSNENSTLGTFQLGDRVPAGPLTYQASETEWKTELAPGRTASNRFLLIKLSIENKGKSTVAVPGFQLRGSDGKTYPEVMERLEGVPNWLGMLRSVEAGKRIDGYAVFDAPVGAHTLAVSDASDPAEEKHALIKIPVEIHDNNP